MKIKITLTIMLALILMISPILADESFVFKKNSTSVLELSLFENDITKCTTCSCTITIDFPNGTNIIRDATTNISSNYAIYNLNSTFTGNSGVYNVDLHCTNSVDSGAATFEYEINPQGIISSEQRTESITRSVYFIFGIGILLFIGFLFTKQSVPIKWTLFMTSIIFLVMGLNILSISLADEVVNPNIESFFDGFTAIAFYFYWFAGGLIIIIWMFTFINTWIMKKNLENIRRFGG